MRFISGYVAAIYRCAMQYYNTMEEKTGLRGYQYAYVLYICRHEGCRAEDIARHLHIDKSNVSRALDKLEAADMIFRRPDPDDMRAYLIYPTERAHNSKQLVRGAVASWDELATENLSPEEKAKLYELLEKVLESAGEAVK